MLIAALVYAGLYTLSRKASPWMAKNHPGARNLAALVIESLGAVAAANAISLVAAMWYPNLHPDAPALNALLAGTFALGMHYLASDLATSLHPIYVPFLVGGIAFLLVPRSISHAVGFGLLLIGATVTVLKYQDLRRNVAGPVRDVPRA